MIGTGPRVHSPRAAGMTAGRAEVLSPDIAWGGRSGWLPSFPPAHELHHRAATTPYAPHEGLMFALGSAARRVWIADPNFDTTAATLLAEWVNLEVSQLRIMGGRGAELLEAESDLRRLLERRAEKESKRGVGTPKRVPDVEWKPTDKHEFPYLHDRFCIVEDELFHFGSTVGGAVPHLSAASRGWNAEERGAVTFFETAWRSL